MNTVLIWLSCWRTTPLGGGWFTQPRQFGGSQRVPELLVEMLEENNIEFVRVEEDD